MENELDERDGQFGYKITTRLKVHEAQIIFGIRIVVLKNQKLGFQFPIFFILPTQNTSFPINIILLVKPPGEENLLKSRN